MKESKTKKFKDPYLKPLILRAVEKIEEFANVQKAGDKSIYYEGNFQEDVLNNFPKKESNIIFNRMKKCLEDNRLLFLQKKIKVNFKKILDNGKSVNDDQYHYEYIVSKR